MLTQIAIILITGLTFMAIVFGFLSLKKLSKPYKIHLTILSIINFIIIGIMINHVWGGGEKTIVLIIFGYPFLIFLNSLMWFILKIKNRPIFKIYKISTFILVLFFIPTLILASI